MKPGVFFYLTVILFSLVSAILLRQRIIPPKHPLPVTGSPTAIPQMPQLYVDGNTIRRADSKTPVRLKGVTSNALAWKTYPRTYRYFTVLNTVRSWNINLLGLFLVPDVVTGHEHDLDKIVSWAEEHRVYIYLMPTTYYDKNVRAELRKFPEMMRQLARRYKNEPNILFGIWAEPSISYSEWRPLAESVARNILTEKPEAVILVNGTEFGRKIDGNNPLPFPNVVYNFHDYPAAGPEDLQPVLNSTVEDFLWENVYRQHPVLIGEFGGVWATGFGEKEDLQYIRRILDAVNRDGLHYTAFAIDDLSGTSPQNGDVRGLRLLDWETMKPTAKGELIKDDLTRFPPTQF